MLARPRLEPLEDRVVPAFFGPVSYVADAREVVVADFNSDNLQDLAVTLPGWVPGSVGVLLGNGDGTFDPVIRSTAGYSPRALTVGDFNGDGDLDVVVAHQGTYDLSVLLGNGDGSFSALSAISIGSEATAMAVGDFNVDGKLDLGVGSNIFIPEEYDPETGQWLGHYEGFATVLLGRGDGSFGAPASTALGQVGYHVRASVGDYNGDGHLDLAAAYTVLLGDGAGNFPDMMGGYPTGDFPPYSVSGDFNRDDIVDIAWANRSSNTVGVARGVGNGVSYAAENFPTGALPIWLATGDFNRDGWLDVVTTGDFSGDVSVLLNDRTWPPPPQPSVSIYFGAAVGEGMSAPRQPRST